MAVCAAPHVIVGASRNFAVYSDEFLAVPARQIGIISPSVNRSLLKALALYLNSDFVTYHQFLTTTQAGIQKSINTLEALRALPVPFDDTSDLTVWDALYSKIVRVCADGDDFNRPDLVSELNEVTFDSLRLSLRGRAAVHDLVHVRLGLTGGRVAPEAVRQPTRDEEFVYARMLRDELDGFVGSSSSTRHLVEVLADGGSGLVSVDLVKTKGKAQNVTIWDASDGAASLLAETRSHLIERRAQWLYFNRNLRIYDGSRTYILKPLQRLHWTQTQAIEDAREIIADSLRPAPSVLTGVAV